MLAAMRGLSLGTGSLAGSDRRAAMAYLAMFVFLRVRSQQPHERAKALAVSDSILRPAGVAILFRVAAAPEGSVARRVPAIDSQTMRSHPAA